MTGGMPVRIAFGGESTPLVVLLDPAKPLGDAEQQKRIARAVLSSVANLDSQTRMTLKRIIDEGPSNRAQLVYSVIDLVKDQVVLRGEAVARHTPQQLAEKLRSMTDNPENAVIRVEPDSQVGGASPSPSPFYNESKVGSSGISVALLYWPSTPPDRSCSPALYLAVGAVRHRLFTSAIVPVYIDARPGLGVFTPPPLKNLCASCDDRRCKATCLYNYNPYGDARSLATLLSNIVTRKREPVASILSKLNDVAGSIAGIGMPRLRLTLGPPMTWSWPNYISTAYVTPYDLVASMPTYHFNVKRVENEAEAQARILRILQGPVG